MKARLVSAALMIAGAAMAVSAAAKAPPRGKNCPKNEITLGQAVEMLKVHRTYKGADGESHIETTTIPGETKSFYGGKTTLTQFDLGDPTRVMLVYGHPNIEIPKHPSPYREIFIILSGSSIMEMPDGTIIERKPGSMVVVEDQNTPGRSGRAGPCGYVALDLQFKPAPK
jgi:quercetin dioxygenase-like cupin family protein